jgi:ABC-2 type transport system ATP-binding protein
LDVNAQASVREFLLEYNRRHGATILLTSHYMADIVALCKRVLLIDKGKLIYDGALDTMIDRVAPYREVKLDLGRTYAADDLSGYGEIHSIEGRAARLLVRREDLTRVLPRLMSELEVNDLTVTDPPIEEIIGRIFTQGATL